MNDIQTIAQKMRDSRPSRTRARKRSKLSGLMSILVGGVLAVLVFFIGRHLLSQSGQQTSSQSPSLLAVASGQYPSGIPVFDVQLARAYLERETPTGKFEEIKWTAENPYRTVLDFRTENPMGGMIKTWIAVARFKNEYKVRLDGYGDMRWIDPADYGLERLRQPAHGNERKTSLPLGTPK